MSAVHVAGRWFLILAVIALSSCGGGDDGGGSFGPGASKVFAVDEVNGGIGSSENANPTPGSTFAITRIITGAATQLPVGPGCFGCLPSLALDSGREQLYVSTNTNILVFNNAGSATGNIAPSRVVSVGGSSTGRHLELNAAADILYVSTPTGTIFRIDNASAASGLTAASRTLTVNTLGLNNLITDIALDATNDVLYLGLSRNTIGSVGVILNISTRVSGAVALDAEITAANLGNPSITVDGPRNRLYVASLFGQVYVYDNASALTSGAAPVSRTIPLPNPIQHRLFVETTNDRLYASAQNRIVIINNAGSATSAVGAAVAQLSTGNSDLTAVVARP